MTRSSPPSTTPRSWTPSPESDPAVVAGQASAAAAATVEPIGSLAEPRAAAFFDVDNTVVRGASLFHLARGLAARRFFTASDVATFAWQQAKYRIIGKEDLDDIAAAIDVALAFVAGHGVEEVTQLGEEIFDERIECKLYAGTIALAQEHLRSGRQVWLVSAAPVEVATLIARRLGLTGALGTVAEVSDGRYTGRLVGEPLHGPAKAEAVRALADRERLDLSQSAAYSDSANDIPLLSLVGHAVAVNPDARLLRHARVHGWQVCDYRTGRNAVRSWAPGVVALGTLVGGLARTTRARRLRTSP